MEITLAADETYKLSDYVHIDNTGVARHWGLYIRIIEDALQDETYIIKKLLPDNRAVIVPYRKGPHNNWGAK